MTTTEPREGRPGDDPDWEARYRAVQGRDRRFDGMFYTAVRTTGIYCRPSCPATTPQRRNVDFYATAAGAQEAGFRACRRCLPDATPGSPQWDVVADAAGRAMRLVADGVVEREGVEGLAARMGYSVRQLHRVVTGEYGAGPLALARSRRVQTARVLVETTDLRFADVAFAAGFASVRQFNDTVREVYAATPRELRASARGREHTRGAGPPSASPGTLRVRVAVREPFAAEDLHWFLAVHVVPGLEAVGDGWYERAVRLPHGPGVVRVELGDRPPGVVPCTLTLADVRDLAPATERARRLLDADCDPVAVDAALAQDRALAPLVHARPGLRVPGQLEPAEVAVQTVLGQQVSLASARTATTRLVAAHGEPLGLAGDHEVSRLFPTMATLAALDPEDPDVLRMPRARARALTTLAAALDAGEVRLDRSLDRPAAREAMLALRGIGPWTADYVAMRALGDPDAFLPTDIGVRNAARHLGIDDVVARSETWRPWRSYALMRLWSVVLDQLRERITTATTTATTTSTRHAPELEEER
ncbi:DNA-3-methyladenine glycosylase II [Nocardioides scoriae]|uniref:DNA-3-methyladenine glycosylase II n=1 Tax=Nocardioides scoriae TaxID=642780 RepID=A0A1H1YC17_9ACTN|nr:AlkA N-terminal domain-containing protein [Nocardioides scoriae]SDT18934.1 DNA-3-methyladenine glycosylase II [Nocardioides scoriae]